jgi:hypothetical protein
VKSNKEYDDVVKNSKKIAETIDERCKEIGADFSFNVEITDKANQVQTILSKGPGEPILERTHKLKR